MKLFCDNENYKIYNGSMLDMLEVIKPDSIDSVVCDPPYHLQSIVARFGKENSAEAQYGNDGAFKRLSKGFMGKEWDGGDIAFQPSTWRKCFEALKPGGYLLAFGGSRTFHRIAVAIEDAGFEIRDTIMWLYGSGFPKSMDISKAIDKRGATSIGWFADYLKQELKNRNMNYSDLAKHFPSKNGNMTGCVHNWVESKNMPTLEQFNKICEILNLPFKNIQECEREVIGKKDTGDAMNWFSNMDTKERNGFVDITVPKSDLANQWQGWGTALKPAYEPIIVARKPFKTTVAENIMENGVGGINIDECRIPFEDTQNPATNPLYRQENKDKYKQIEKGQESNGAVNFTSSKNDISNLGRFPANVIHDGSEETTDNMLEASRYFYTAKASKKDRDEGLEIASQKVNDGRKTEIDNPFQRGETLRKNTHPTVKPCELMQYLVRLVSPKGAIILDPFMGSGSTGKAVMFENRERDANYKFIGIDLEKEYCNIANARIDYALNKYEYDYLQELKKAEEKGQLSLF